MIESNHDSALARLRQIAVEGLKGRSGFSVQDFDLIEQELGVIEKCQIAAHLLMVWDLFNFARQRNIGIGPPRGPITSSLVCYAISITNIHPRCHGLNVHLAYQQWAGLPRIDIEVCIQRRLELIDYLQTRYGKENILQGTPTEDHPSAVLLRMPGAAPESNEHGRDTHPNAQWLRRMERKGYWRLHLIGYSPVTVIQKTIDRLAFGAEPNPVDPEGLATKEALDVFRSGDLTGLCPLDDESVSDVFQGRPPDSLDDLAFAYGMMFHPAELADSAHKVSDPAWGAIEEIAEVLSTTRNVLLFKEQAIRIISRLSDATDAQALTNYLTLRSGRIRVELLEINLEKGAARLGIKKSQTTRLIEYIREQSLLDLSHALAMSYLALRAAWLKAHSPDAFMDAYREVESSL